MCLKACCSGPNSLLNRQLEFRGESLQVRHCFQPTGSVQPQDLYRYSMFPPMHCWVQELMIGRLRCGRRGRWLLPAILITFQKPLLTHFDEDASIYLVGGVAIQFMSRVDAGIFFPFGKSSLFRLSSPPPTFVWLFRFREGEKGPTWIDPVPRGILDIPQISCEFLGDSLTMFLRLQPSPPSKF